MSRFMVAGFVQLETIVKVDSLPIPYFQFQSIPDMINASIGGCGYNESVALKWLGNEVDFMSMVGKGLKENELYKKLMGAKFKWVTLSEYLKATDNFNYYALMYDRLFDRFIDNSKRYEKVYIVGALHLLLRHGISCTG